MRPGTHTMKQPDLIIFAYALEFHPTSAAASACQLSQLSHERHGVNPRWQAFVDTLPCPTVCLDASGLRERHPDFATKLPAVISRREGQLQALITAQEIADLQNLGELIEFTCDRLYDDDLSTLLNA